MNNTSILLKVHTFIYTKKYHNLLLMVLKWKQDGANTYGQFW